MPDWGNGATLPPLDPRKRKRPNAVNVIWPPDMNIKGLTENSWLPQTLDWAWPSLLIWPSQIVSHPSTILWDLPSICPPICSLGHGLVPLSTDSIAIAFCSSTWLQQPDSSSLTPASRLQHPDHSIHPDSGILTPTAWFCILLLMEILGLSRLFETHGILLQPL